ncbi:MAG: sigma-54 dependent transcriptional regulator [Gemmatimonadaceae bacterium]
MTAVILLTDVEPAVRLNALLERAGITTEMVSPLDDVRGAIRRAKPDVIVFTGALLDPTNANVVRDQLWEGESGAAVVGLMDTEDIDERERLRAAGYTELFAKPIAPDDLAAGVRRVLERRQLQRETGLIGESDAVREVLIKVEQMAPVTSTVLVEGESGTGKELVARGLHRLGPRRAKPFIAVNVGALAETLLESELFGHEKGAFTGAAERRIGRFELADGGTLFLDEIGEIPQATQVKLLRVLEERELTRVGGTQPIRVDVRVVAATNRPLREHVETGQFRADLYYRLNVLGIYLPPLRERREDIPLLVRRFIADFGRQHDRDFRGISADAMQLLAEYPWPGNVRELRNLVESMVVLAPNHEVGPADLPSAIRSGGGARLLPVTLRPVLRERDGAHGHEFEFILRSLVELKLQVEELRRRVDDQRAVREAWIGEVRPGVLSAPRGGEAIEARGTEVAVAGFTVAPGMTMAAIERAAIEEALKSTRGNRRKAAEILGIGERTLYRKLREYELPASAVTGDEIAKAAD